MAKSSRHLFIWVRRTVIQRFETNIATVVQAKGWLLEKRRSWRSLVVAVRSLRSQEKQTETRSVRFGTLCADQPRPSGDRNQLNLTLPQ